MNHKTVYAIIGAIAGLASALIVMYAGTAYLNYLAAQEKGESDGEQLKPKDNEHIQGQAAEGK